MESTDRLRELAAALDAVIEDDLALLADVKPQTVEAWRKRGIGPAYVRLGNRFLYPRTGLAEHLKTLLRQRPQATAARELL
jgi:hypothetical protein